MGVRMDKAWRPLDAEQVARLGGELGVYELRDGSGETRFIGYAGGRSLFGLRGELERELRERGPGYWFRHEVNMQYTTRALELLMVYRADHGALPRDNRDAHAVTGRLHPA